MATMKDVAKLAGVSLGSVSNVVNGVAVKKNTYLKVQEAIKELGYETNNIARSIKTNKSNTIALILPTIWHPYFSKIAFYIEQIADENNYKVLICNSNGNSQVEQRYFKMLRENMVDGIVAITYSDIEMYVESNLPFVSIDRHFQTDINIVASDNFAGGYLAAKTLTEKGAKNLLYIGSHNKFTNETMKRRQGFEKFCKENYVPFTIIDLLEPNSSYDSFKDELEILIDNDIKIDGIFSINDYVGLDVIDILAKKGYQVLKDFQIIGFDGIKMSSERNYHISTIVQDVENIAREAFNLLEKQIDNIDTVDQVILPVSFAEGGTTRD